jgi:hypothetical protein
LVAPGAVRRGDRLAGALARRAGVAFVAVAVGFVDRVRVAGLRAAVVDGSLAVGLDARVEGGERLAKPVGLLGELVWAFLDLVTQTIDHVHFLALRAGDRTRRRLGQAGQHPSAAHRFLEPAPLKLPTVAAASAFSKRSRHRSRCPRGDASGPDRQL